MEDGLDDRDRLEVSLVHRNGLANSSAIFFAEVAGAGTSEGRRFLNVRHEENIKEIVYLDAYLLLSITWKPDKMAPMDTVDVEGSPEAQNDGYEVICHILEQAGIKEQVHEKEPEMMKTLLGPKRIEAKLFRKSDPDCTVNVVVIEYHPPKGPFRYHTLKGRPWNTASKKLENIIQTYHENSWWIYSVVKHVSPGRSTTSFHGRQDSQGWRRVEDFLKIMQPSEINVLRHLKWQQKGDSEEDDDIGKPSWGCGRQHPGGVPDYYRNPYKAPAVFFRVSGDEVGKKAFLIQAEKRIKDCPDPPTLEEFLEEAEKKAVAGDASDSKKISSAASDLSDDASRGSGNSNGVDTNNVGNPSVTGANDSDLPTPDPELDFLEIDDPYASHIVPYLPGMEGVPFSAVKRTSRRFPRKKKERTLH